MATDNWQDVHAWHELFDRLCGRAGHHDNAALASAYCVLIGRSASGDFEVAQKNLRSWRRGRHLPLRRNAIVLARLLGVEEDAELRRRWNALYAAARREPPAPEQLETGSADAAEREPPQERHRHLHPGALALAVVLAVGAGFYGFARYGARADLPIVNYEARVRMLVGESRLINANRGDCKGGPAPDWQHTSPRVPRSTLGSFSDGGVAWTPSVFCNGMAIARAVRFTATHPGEEEVELLGSYIKIVVTEPGRSGPGEAAPVEATMREVGPGEVEADIGGARRR